MIYHITDNITWEHALAAGVYKHPTLTREGFIHCCKKDQLEDIAERYFNDADELVILHIVDRRIKNLIRFEVASNEVTYPHIYGPIPLDAVEDVSIVNRNEFNNFEW